MPQRRRSSGESARAPQAAAASESQRSADHGNGAAAEQVAGVDDPQSILAEHADGAAITVGGTLPGGLVLGEVDGNTFQTDSDSSITVGVARWGAWVDMHPPLEVRPGSFLHRTATGGITVRRVQVSFSNGKASVNLDTGRMGNLLDWAFDLEDKLAATFESAIEGALPSDLKGFDPFTDPDITAKVQKIVAGFSSGLGSGGGGQAQELAAQIEDPKVGVSITPKMGEWDLGEDLKVVVGERAYLKVQAAMAGTLQDAMDAPQVERLNLSATDLTVEHKTAGALASIGIRSAVINPDMSIERFDYDLSTEGILGGLKALGMLLQLRTGEDLGIRDMNSPRLEALREIIDGKVHAKVPDVLREQIEANRGIIPGMDLAEVLPGSVE